MQIDSHAVQLTLLHFLVQLQVPSDGSRAKSSLQFP